MREWRAEAPVPAAAERTPTPTRTATATATGSAEGPLPAPSPIFVSKQHLYHPSIITTAYVKSRSRLHFEHFNEGRSVEKIQQEN